MRYDVIVLEREMCTGNRARWDDVRSPLEPDFGLSDYSPARYFTRSIFFPLSLFSSIINNNRKALNTM